MVEEVGPFFLFFLFFFKKDEAKGLSSLSGGSQVDGLPPAASTE